MKRYAQQRLRNAGIDLRRTRRRITRNYQYPVYLQVKSSGRSVTCHPKCIHTCPLGLPCPSGPNAFIMHKPTKMVKTVLAYALKFPNYKLIVEDLEQRNSVQNYFCLFLWCFIPAKNQLQNSTSILQLSTTIFKLLNIHVYSAQHPTLALNMQLKPLTFNFIALLNVE